MLLYEGLPVISSQSNIREQFQRQFAESETDGLNPVEEIQVSGDWAFARGTFERTETPDEGDPVTGTGKWVSVLLKTPAGWKYAVDAFNRNAPTETDNDETDASMPESRIPEGADAEAVQALTSSWDAALNARDADSISALYTDDAIRMSADQPAHVGAEAIRATFEEEFAGTNFTEEGPVHCLEVAGDWAHAWGTWSQTGTDATGNAVEESGKWLEILKRTPEGWKIYIEIWNRG